MDPSTPGADHNLLLAILAHQSGLLDPFQFIECCAAIKARADINLLESLIRREWIAPPVRAALEKQAQDLLAAHGGDVRACLDELMNDQTRATVTRLDLPPYIAPGKAPADETVARPPAERDFSSATTPFASQRRYVPIGARRRGGIGQVWRARDNHLGREVALKELRPEYAKSETHRARFLAEAKITSQLTHPNIVPAFELIDENGELFYTMQYVEGRTLTDAVKEYHDKHREGKAGVLELRNLLNVLVAVCRAVDYAHHRGVLHRDLKGPNVVLGEHGEAFLLDWGMAKVLGSSDPDPVRPPIDLGRADSDAETVQGQQLGTPLYMSPEQAAGNVEQIDRRTDVYALGVILYEILTGALPFTVSETPPAGEDLPGTPEEQLLSWRLRKLERLYHKIRTETPLAPRQLNPQAPQALEHICLKCLSKERDDRYETAAALADEVERWLADEPVKACPDPWTVRAFRWARRHRVLVASFSALLLAALPLLVALFLVSENNREELTNAQKKTQEALERAVKSGEAAKASAKEARDNAERAARTLRYIIKDLQAKLQGKAGVYGIRREILETAARDLKELYGPDRKREGIEQLLIEAELTLLEADLNEGDIALLGGHLFGALEKFKAVITAVEAYVEGDPRQPLAQDVLLKAKTRQAETMRELGQMGDAVRLYQHVHQARKRQLDDNSLDTHARRELIGINLALGAVHLDKGERKHAEEAFKEAMSHSRLLEKANDKSAAFLLALAYQATARLLFVEGRHELAESAALLCLAYHERLSTRDAKDVRARRERCNALDLLADILLARSAEEPDAARRQKMLQEALAKYEEAWGPRFYLAQEDEEVVSFLRELSLSHQGKALAFRRLEDLIAAEAQLDEARKVREKLAEKALDHPRLQDEQAQCLLQLGKVQMDLGDLDRAANSIRAGLEIRRRAPETPETSAAERRKKVQCWLALGRLDLKRGDLDGAEAKWKKGKEMLKLPGPEQAAEHEALLKECEDGLSYCQRARLGMADGDWANLDRNRGELICVHVAFLLQQGHFDAACKLTRDFEQHASDDPEILFLLALAHSQCHGALAGPMQARGSACSRAAIDVLTRLQKSGFVRKPSLAFDVLSRHVAFQSLRGQGGFQELFGPGKE